MAHNNRTIDEIVRYILQNDGPGEKYRAHPNLKISINELELALRYLPEKFSDLKPYHFKSVINLWHDENGNPTKYAREVTWRVIQEHISKCHYKDLNDFIERFSWDDFRNGILIDRINEREIAVNTEKMLKLAYGSCAPEAVLDCVKDKFPEEYKKLGFEHLSYRPKNVYCDREGNPTKKARGVVGKLIDFLLKTRYRDLNELIENVTTYDFTEVKLSEEIAGHEFRIDTKTVLFQGYKKSPASAILDYIRHDPNLKEKYENLDFEHFNKVRCIWCDSKGNITDKAREVTGKLINYLIHIRRFKDFNDMISNINTDDFLTKPLNEKVAEHNFSINTSSLLIVYNGSAARAVLDFVRHDPKLSEQYAGLDLIHFYVFNVWTLNGKSTTVSKKVTERVVEKHISSGRYRSLNDLIGSVSQEDFKNGVLVDVINGQEFVINTENMLHQAYKSSPVKAVLDYIRNSKHAKKYEQLSEEHFSYYPRRYLTDKYGKPTKNARRILIKFFTFLIDSGRYENLNDLIQNIHNNDFTENPMHEKIAGKKFKINTSAILSISPYKGSSAKALLDILRNVPAFKEVYANLDIEHIGRVANTWADKEKKPTDKAREVTGKLINSLIGKERFRDFDFMIENIIDDDFLNNPMTERIANHDFPIKTSSLLGAYNGSPARAVLDYVRHDDLLWLKYSGLKLYHFSSVRNIWIDKEGNPTEHAREVTGKLINHLVTTGEFANIDECMTRIRPKHFSSNVLFDEINGHKFYINTASMLDTAYHNSVTRAIKDYRERLAA